MSFSDRGTPSDGPIPDEAEVDTQIAIISAILSAFHAARASIESATESRPMKSWMYEIARHARPGAVHRMWKCWDGSTPAPAVLKQMTPRTILAMLEYLSTHLDGRRPISESTSKWIFALLAALPSHLELTNESVSSIRQVGVAAVDAKQASRRNRSSGMATGGDSHDLDQTEAKPDQLPNSTLEPPLESGRGEYGLGKVKSESPVHAAADTADMENNTTMEEVATELDELQQRKEDLLRNLHEEHDATPERASDPPADPDPRGTRSKEILDEETRFALDAIITIVSLAFGQQDLLVSGWGWY